MADKEIIIEKLEFPENIRRRPGKEIGSTEKPDVLLREVIDNSIDEIYGCSTCDSIYVITKDMNGWNLVADNGRGIPIRMKGSITMTELATCHMDAGSKFSKVDSVAIGMNGHGIKATNALSNRFVVLSKITENNFDKSIPEVRRCWELYGGKEEIFYFIYFEKGYKKNEGANTKKNLEEGFGISFPEGMSTVTAFQPDETIFTKVACEFPSRNLKYLNFIAKSLYNKGKLNILLNGEPIHEDYQPLSNVFTKEIETNEGYKIKFLVNFEFDKNLNVVEVTGSVNSLPVDRGIHIDLIRNAYTNALSNYFGITHGYLFYGIRLNVIVLAGEVDFSSQTKERLTYLAGTYSRDIDTITELSKGFNTIFKEHEEDWKGHVQRLEILYESMQQISIIDQIKSNVQIASNNRSSYKSNMPANVDDATSSDRSQCSLYIVEGQSAGGNMVKARDRRYDAIFYLRGKPMNGVMSEKEQLWENREMKAIINAVGCGMDEYQVVENPPFSKIIIATDADADGRNIASMLIAFFCARMPAIVRAGMLYSVETPLFIQDGKFAYLGDDVENIIDKSKPFSRIKGLGELDPEELEKYIFDKENRRLVQITMENAKTAIDLVTSTFARKALLVSKQIIRDPYNVGV